MVFCANGCRRSELHEVLKDRDEVRVAKARVPLPPRPIDARRLGAALRLAECALPAVGTLADTYLSGRGLQGLAHSEALRFLRDAPHPEGGRLPALVALVASSDGAIVGIHRTFLAPDGRGKAGVSPDRASLGPVWGGAIRLAAPDVQGAIVIGEGIESSASAGRLMGLPAWAAISAGNLGRGLILPPEVRRVVIAVDPDPPGEAAARDAADRWQGLGVVVQLARPVGEGDFNDVLRARTAANV